MIDLNFLMNVASPYRSPSFTQYASEVLSGNLTHKMAHFIFNSDSPSRLDIPTLYVSQITFIHGRMEVFSKGDEALNAFLLREPVKNTLDLNSFVLAFRIWQEEDLIEWFRSGGQIDHDAIFTLPNNMKLCFEPNMLEFEQHPTKTSLASVDSNMLWHDHKTFVEWFIDQGQVLDINRIHAGDQLSAECTDVILPLNRNTDIHKKSPSLNKTSSELNSCPFCNSDDVGHCYRSLPNEQEAVAIYCQNCASTGPMMTAKTNNQEQQALADSRAKEGWNKRT